ncbi:heparinase II/III family protein [Paenibacillus sp. CAU 1782]
MGAVANYLFFEPGQREAWGADFAKTFPSQTRKAINEADRWCQGGEIVWKNMNIDLGTPINWLHNPTGDKEFTWGINRFKHLRSLGIAYACTGDEKYAARALEHILGWIETQPCPHGLPAEELTYFQRPGPWRLLEVGLRLRQWTYAYHFFDGSASWREEGRSRFLASVKEHAHFLADYKASIEINHSIMHMIGLLSAALTFASWEESGEWTKTAVQRLEECIAVQVLPDGVHAELTPHYHMVSLELFVDCAVMLKKRGLAFSERYEGILAGMARFAYSMKRQDGSMAPFADSFANQPPDLNAAALYYKRPELLLHDQLHEQMWTVGPEAINDLVAAEGAEAISGGPLVELPFSFPHAGYYGLGGGGQQMIFDAAALGGPHGHADALSFELCAFGEALFVDPGTYTYMENPWRRYFKSTAAHNTVLVDGQDQTPYVRTQRWGTPEASVNLIRWEPEQGLICAEHDGYALRGVKHRRAVWFLDSGEWVILDRLAAEAGAEHVYQHRLHARLLDWVIKPLELGVDGSPGLGVGDSFGVDERPSGEGSAGTGCPQAACYYADGSGLEAGADQSPLLQGCELLLFGPRGMELDVEDSWESVHQLTMTPLKVVQGLTTSSEGTWFATVIKPHTGDKALEPSHWGILKDEEGNPVLTLRRNGEEKRFVMPQ